MRKGAWQSAATNAPAAAPATAPTASDESNRSFSGSVVETMDAAGYTYVLVSVGQEKLWAAAPKTTVKVGDKVTITDGMPMKNYHSNTLNRDFPLVYFAASLGGNGGTGQLPAGHPPLHTAASKNPVKVAVELNNIAKAPGGYTVQELYAQKATLAGKSIAVRGKVVKYNAQIMGKNWLHLRDGSGAEGSNDLTITTSTAAKVGDTVLATGILTADKDFGAGYKFAVILDDAKIVVE